MPDMLRALRGAWRGASVDAILRALLPISPLRYGHSGGETSSVSLPDVASSTRLLDIRASALSLSDGDPVATWGNAGTAGGSFTQSGSARPTYRAGAGHPYLEFDGVDDWMLGPDVANNLSSFTVFVARENYEGAVITKVQNDNCSDPGCTGWSVFGRNINLYTDTSNQIYQSAEDITVRAVWTHEVVSPSELHVTMNGVVGDQQPSGGTVFGDGASGGYSTTEPLRIGTDGSGGLCDGVPLAADAELPIRLYAIRIYAPAPSASDRQAIIEDMAADTGVTL